MWWEPRDPASQETATVVSQIAERYFEHVEASHEEREQPEQLVWGIGSGLDLDGRWRPLVLLSQEALARAEVFPPLGRSTIGALREALRINEVWGLLDEWQLPPQTLVEAVTRPVPAWNGVEPGQLVEEAAPSNRHATVGLTCRLKRTDDVGFVTAGHLVDRGRSQVVVTGRSYTGQPKRISGTVVAWSDPYKSGPIGGFDYAVVQADDGVTFVNNAGPQPAPVPPYVPLNALILRDGWQGGGPSYGMVTGALTQVGDGDRQWRSCWMLGPSFLLDRGDSGTLLMTMTAEGHPDRILGHFVGGSYWPGTRGLVHLYVQDFSECLQGGYKTRSISMLVLPGRDHDNTVCSCARRRTRRSPAR